MDSSDSLTLLLPSGRKIGYAVYGSPSPSPTNPPLLYLHGYPSSRLEAYALHTLAQRLKIQILSLDRPGFGLSSPSPSRLITDYPSDVQAFADAMGLGRFMVLGVSGGGPYALAVAKVMGKGKGERVAAVGVLAGAAHWDKGWRTEVPWYARVTYLGVNYFPGLFGGFLDGVVGMARWAISTRWVVGRIDAFLEKVGKEQVGRAKRDADEVPLKGESLVAETDGEDEEQEPVRTIAQRREGLMAVLFGGFTQGAAACVQEGRLLSQDWGFRFEDIEYDAVQVWHGSRDVNAPVVRVREMAKRIPHCVLKEFNEDHRGMGNHFEQVLEEMIAAASKKSL